LDLLRPIYEFVPNNYWRFEFMNILKTMENDMRISETIKKQMRENEASERKEFNKLIDVNLQLSVMDETTENMDAIFDIEENSSLSKIGFYSIHVFNLERKIQLLSGELIKQHYDFYQLLIEVYSETRAGLLYRIDDLQRTIDFDFAGYPMLDSFDFNQWLRTISKHKNDISSFKKETK